MGMLRALHTSVYLHRRASFLNFSTSSKSICFTVNLLIRIQKSNVPSCITEYLLVKVRLTNYNSLQWECCAPHKQTFIVGPVVKIMKTYHMFGARWGLTPGEPIISCVFFCLQVDEPIVGRAVLLRPSLQKAETKNAQHLFQNWDNKWNSSPH